ncbi:hypothetical protein ACB092_01G071300 [Castanea dentata]
MELFSIQTLLFFFLLSLYLYFRFNTPTKKPIKKPGPKIYPILGVLPDFLKNRHRFLDWSTESLRDCPTNTDVFWRLGKGYGFITANPSNVEHMLKTNFGNYPKGNIFMTVLKDFLGQGIFNSDGELWKIQRKTASYEFNTKSLRNFIMENVTVEISTRLVPVLTKALETQQVLDLQDILERFAFDNICKLAFNVDPSCLKKDLLSRFMSNEENSPKFLRDVVISFILAGRDTTSSSLSWFFWLLSSHPKVEQNILKELETIRVRYRKNIGETYSYDELHDMHYLHAAISEALRLYPPVPTDTKTCLNDDIMPDGTFVGKGWEVSYQIYGMGRMESIWGKNCFEFLPERWIENGVCKQESPFRFAVFQAGPRICLGKDMAYIQMKSIAATVMERFEIEAESKGKVPEYLLALTLRMKGGLPVRVRKRWMNEIN